MAGALVACTGPPFDVEVGAANRQIILREGIAWTVVDLGQLPIVAGDLDELDAYEQSSSYLRPADWSNKAFWSEDGDHVSMLVDGSQWPGALGPIDTPFEAALVAEYPGRSRTRVARTLVRGRPNVAEHHGLHDVLVQDPWCDFDGSWTHRVRVWPDGGSQDLGRVYQVQDRENCLTNPSLQWVSPPNPMLDRRVQAVKALHGPSASLAPVPEPSILPFDETVALDGTSVGLRTGVDWAALFRGEAVVAWLEGPIPAPHDDWSPENAGLVATNQGWGGTRLLWAQNGRLGAVLFADQWFDVLGAVDRPLEAALVAVFREDGVHPLAPGPNVVAHDAGYDVAVTDCPSGAVVRVRVTFDAVVTVLRTEDQPGAVCGERVP